jgi:hypothetical protein
VVLSWETLELRKICLIEEQAIESLGVPVAEVLKRRLADLSAYNNLSEVVIGNLRESIDETGMFLFKLDLTDDYEIVFCCSQDKQPVHDGSIQLDKVKRIKILRIAKPTK